MNSRTLLKRGFYTWLELTRRTQRPSLSSCYMRVCCAHIIRVDSSECSKTFKVHKESELSCKTCQESRVIKIVEEIWVLHILSYKFKDIYRHANKWRAKDASIVSGRLCVTLRYLSVPTGENRTSEGTTRRVPVFVRGPSEDPRDLPQQLLVNPQCTFELTTQSKCKLSARAHRQYIHFRHWDGSCSLRWGNTYSLQ